MIGHLTRRVHSSVVQLTWFLHGYIDNAVWEPHVSELAMCKSPHIFRGVCGVFMGRVLRDSTTRACGFDAGGKRCGFQQAWTTPGLFICFCWYRSDKPVSLTCFITFPASLPPDRGGALDPLSQRHSAEVDSIAGSEGDFHPLKKTTASWTAVKGNPGRHPGPSPENRHRLYCPRTGAKKRPLFRQLYQHHDRPPPRRPCLREATWPSAASGGGWQAGPHGRGPGPAAGQQ